MQILKSALDESVNFVEKTLEGAVESRYVRRADDYFIGYLSSQTGCNHSCKFCHLTTTNQKQFKNITPPVFHIQASRILKHYKTQNAAKIVNWNFMARGEPLANPYITDASYTVFGSIVNASDLPLIHRFNISTIMPVSLKKPLEECFPVIQPTLYYSIYSTSEEFRKKWLPAAMPVKDALRMLKHYQLVTGKEVKFHSAFIKGENDSNHDIHLMMAELCSYDFKGHASFNIVRYNPYSVNEGEETSEEQLLEIKRIIEMYDFPCRIVTRVGEDVHASCGCFVNANA